RVCLPRVATAGHGTRVSVTVAADGKASCAPHKEPNSPCRALCEFPLRILTRMFIPSDVDYHVEVNFRESEQGGYDYLASTHNQSESPKNKSPTAAIPITIPSRSHISGLDKT
ncbi:unnamed protein product, partial [Sphacelaria rigidula]